MEQTLPCTPPSPAQIPLGLCSGWGRGCLQSKSLRAKCPCVSPHPDDAVTTEQPQPNLPDQLVIVNEMEANARPCKSLAKSVDMETVSLSPSLTPAQQPTISLLCEDSADTLSVESLTLVPPVDPHSLHTLAGIPPPPLLAAESTVTPGKEIAHPEPAGPTEH